MVDAIQIRRSLLWYPLAVLSIPVFLAIAWLLYGQYADWRYVHPWEQVARGDSEETVVALLGRPHRVVFEQTNNASWESEHNIDWYNAESVKRYRYIPLSITGEEYDVALDSSGRAVSKIHITSP